MEWNKEKGEVSIPLDGMYCINWHPMLTNSDNHQGEQRWLIIKNDNDLVVIIRATESNNQRKKNLPADCRYRDLTVKWNHDKMELLGLKTLLGFSG